MALVECTAEGIDCSLLQILSIVVISRMETLILLRENIWNFVGCVFLHILITCASSKKMCLGVLNHTSIIQFRLDCHSLSPLCPLEPFQSQIGKIYFHPVQRNFLNGPLAGSVEHHAKTSCYLDELEHLAVHLFCNAEGSQECKKILEIPIGVLGSIGAYRVWELSSLSSHSLVFKQDDIEIPFSGSRSLGQPWLRVSLMLLAKSGPWHSWLFLHLLSSWWGHVNLDCNFSSDLGFARDNGLPFSWIKKVNKVVCAHQCCKFGGLAAIVIGLLCLIGNYGCKCSFHLYIAGNYLPGELLPCWDWPAESTNSKPGPFYLGPHFRPP